MTARATTVEIDQALKAKHRAMWALGDYPICGRRIIPDLGAVLVEAAVSGPASECSTWRPGRAMPPFPQPWPERAWWLAT